MGNDFLNEKTRAEDILLGSLGFGEEASILEVHPTKTGFAGTGCWDDGEEFSFESEEDIPLDDLEEWALQILCEGEPIAKAG